MFQTAGSFGSAWPEVAVASVSASLFFSVLETAWLWGCDEDGSAWLSAPEYSDECEAPESAGTSSSAWPTPYGLWKSWSGTLRAMRVSYPRTARIIHGRWIQGGLRERQHPG